MRFCYNKAQLCCAYAVLFVFRLGYCAPFYLSDHLPLLCVWWKGLCIVGLSCITLS